METSPHTSVTASPLGLAGSAPGFVRFSEMWLCLRSRGQPGWQLWSLAAGSCAALVGVEGAAEPGEAS